MDLAAALFPFGLRRLGDCPDGDDQIVLIGPDEPRFWDIFCQSAEYRGGAPDPLDRWSRRVITDVAGQMGAAALFPFGGPPYAPFYSWALKTGRFWASPIGFLVHDEAGLFVSFRGALRLSGLAKPPVLEQPCDACAQPCHAACPVGAFDDGYNVDACKAHLRADAGRDCRNNGCLARRACPVGQGKRLPAQSQFHMDAFL